LPRDISQETADGWRDNGEDLAKAFRGVLLPPKNEKEKTKILLKLISGGRLLTVDAVDGSEILADATDFAYRDSDLKNWGADEKGPATSETFVEVHEIAKDATFSQMFGSLNADVSKLCLTQHQIKNFARKHRNWLRTDGYATFFLFESRKQFFVAGVEFNSDDELDVGVGRFKGGCVWDAEGRHRVVVPQLA
jgi:hypothetical protein